MNQEPPTGGFLVLFVVLVQPFGFNCSRPLITIIGLTALSADKGAPDIFVL
jgi:hypothetical protein